MQTFTGIEYLKIDVASNFGLDKKDWDDRIAWFDKHEDELEQLLPAAKEPALYHAGVQAYRKTLKGEATGYPISLDATASGLQMLACLVGCEASAKLCNVVSTGHREDAYKNLYHSMCKKVGDTAKIEHDDTKKAIMTAFYGSTAQPKAIFGEGDLLQAFYETLEQEAPGAWELNQSLQALWQPYELSHDWVLPDNFHAHIDVEDQISRYVQFQNVPVEIPLTVNLGTKEGRSLCPNIIHSIDGLADREIHRRCNYDVDMLMELCTNLINQENGRSTSRPQDRMVMRLWQLYQDSGFLSARILDQLDAENLGHVDNAVIRELVNSMPDIPFPVISIFDCFRVHPNNGNDLRQQYNNILADISKSDLLAFIATQITGVQAVVIKRQNITSQIYETDYALS